MSELSLSPQMEVDTYLSKPEWLLELFIDSEDPAETDSSYAERMGKNNWYVEKAVYVSVCVRFQLFIDAHMVNAKQFLQPGSQYAIKR